MQKPKTFSIKSTVYKMKREKKILSAEMKPLTLMEKFKNEENNSEQKSQEKSSQSTFLPSDYKRITTYQLEASEYFPCKEFDEFEF